MLMVTVRQMDSEMQKPKLMVKQMRRQMRLGTQKHLVTVRLMPMPMVTGRLMLMLMVTVRQMDFERPMPMHLGIVMLTLMHLD